MCAQPSVGLKHYPLQSRFATVCEQVHLVVGVRRVDALPARARYVLCKPLLGKSSTANEHRRDDTNDRHRIHDRRPAPQWVVLCRVLLQGTMHGSDGSEVGWGVVQCCCGLCDCVVMWCVVTDVRWSGKVTAETHLWRHLQTQVLATNAVSTDVTPRWECVLAVVNVASGWCLFAGQTGVELELSCKLHTTRHPHAYTAHALSHTPTKRRQNADKLGRSSLTIQHRLATRGA